MHRIGEHALHDRWLPGIALVALIGTLLGVHFAPTLVVAGLTYALARRNLTAPAVALQAAFVLALAGYAIASGGLTAMPMACSPTYEAEKWLSRAALARPRCSHPA